MRGTAPDESLYRGHLGHERRHGHGGEREGHELPRVEAEVLLRETGAPSQ